MPSTNAGLGCISASKVIEALSRQSAKGSLVDAVKRVQESLDDFVTAFEGRRPRQSDFVVVGIRANREHLYPVGVKVQSIAKGNFVGQSLVNDCEGSEHELVTLHENEVVDWRYADCFDLQGGFLFRAAIDLVDDKITRRSFLEDRHDFLLDGFGECDALSASLYRSVAHGNIGEVKAILEKNPQLVGTRCVVPCFTGDGWLMLSETSLIEWAVRHASSTMCSLLASAGALSPYEGVKRRGFMENEDGYIESLVFDAVRSNNVETLKWLWDCGFDVSVTGYDNEPPIVVAAGKHDSRDLVKCLLSLGATVDSKNHLGRTALFYASSVETAKLLIEHGALVDTIDQTFQTAAEYHDANNRSAVRDVLASHGTRLSKRNARLGVILSRKDAIAQIVEHVRETKGIDEAMKIQKASQIDFGFLLPVSEL